MSTKYVLRILLRYRLMFMIALEMALVTGSLLAAFLLRFEFRIPPAEVAGMWRGVAVALVAKIAIYRVARYDRSGWRYFGLLDLRQLAAANLGGSLLFAIAAWFLVPGFPRSVFVIDLLICAIGSAAAPLSVRLYYEAGARHLFQPSFRQVLVYGAGTAGMTLVREIRSNLALQYRVVGFLDDDPHKRGMAFNGAAVFGSGREAAAIVSRLRRRGLHVAEIVIAMPSANGRQMQEAMANSHASGVAVKTVPSLGELLSGKVLSSQIRNVSVEDLLGREPVRLDDTVIREALEGRTVMITGAAGSIGSELCRQVARFQPRRIVAFEQAESELFHIHRELQSSYPDVEVVPQVGDIRDCQRVDEVIVRNQVDAIFHAAAYKHVPMMEDHVVEAVKNNILGTRNVVYAAWRRQVGSFLMISSDKAVNPTNVMGATKRVAELIVSAMPLPSDGGITRFVSVRFGNVLGSNGSVIPLFKEQIAKGGPVTVTHPEMRRYFMTIPEASQLVLQASTMGKGSEIFVLDMGQPVKIVDLARNMIQLSGKQPDVDIEIRFTGLRPGEKLFEELLTKGENILPTYHEKIKIFSGSQLSRGELEAWTRQLEALIAGRAEQSIVSHLCSLVPEYEPSEQWRSRTRAAGGAEQDVQTVAQ
jgi:FlaA1/EpsC-like NDP-sugar epimerase